MATISIPSQTGVSAARKHNDKLSLSTLPKEIRDKIYDFLFEAQHYPLHLKVEANELTFRQNQASLRHILHVCQQLAAEARPVFQSKVTALGLDCSHQPAPLLEQIYRSPFNVTKLRQIHLLTEDYDKDVEELIDLLPYAKELHRVDISCTNREGDYKVLIPKQKFEAFTQGGRQALRRMFGGRIGTMRMELKDSTIDKALGALGNLQHEKPLVVVRLVSEIVGRGCKATADGGAIYLDLTSRRITWHVQSLILATEFDSSLDLQVASQTLHVGELLDHDPAGSGYVSAHAPRSSSSVKVPTLTDNHANRRGANKFGP